MKLDGRCGVWCDGSRTVRGSVGLGKRLTVSRLHRVLAGIVLALLSQRQEGTGASDQELPVAERALAIRGNRRGVATSELYVVVPKLDRDWIFLSCVRSYFCRRARIVSDVTSMRNKERNLPCVRVLCESWSVICDLWWERV